MAVTLWSTIIELQNKGAYIDRDDVTLWSTIVEVYKKNTYNRAPVVMSSIIVEIKRSPYNDLQTVTTKANNAGLTGFNDWDYSIMAPENFQINNYIEEATYDEILALVAAFPVLTVTNTAGLLTDFNYTEP